ncbi:DUF3105 domain-containing protein [Meiothermus granaticius]|uniref:DUF3105 domain-containing protein n=1 Tax=Meiothermus granaticius NBRC 107808 TaxID=1227551 RepID=A0A399FDG6_9DEIN|nr:DUF3105 domain-containing protein [Meiothermus granaticius]MCL6527337.1 DUF3105 domain-containing protein [Thermaceae bacterium]RIH93469.1 hypothetical protein Mgrana_00523 [Meiothermus granaticius NBRC 107808]GEM85963.1 hypothetical protein MGR01S_05880 [Meiothermus granaticius NBRC 107808]
MAKNPTNRQASLQTPSKKTSRYGSKPRVFPWTALIIVGVVVLGLGWGGWSWWQGRQAGSQFDTLSGLGKAALKRVETQTDYGRGHTEGQALSYSSDPPTSGTHSGSWVNPGFYSQAQPKEQLVHALEHGNVVVYYDPSAQAAQDQLRAWAQQFSGSWDGLVVVPKLGLGQSVELTAWNKLLRLESWDAPAAAAFIDAFRGRGPENPVR